MPPSLDLALIGNCTVSALVDPMASIVWCCLPRFDGEPVFNRLLQGPESPSDQGVMAVILDKFVSSQQAYDPNTAVLRTLLTSADGHVVEVTDFAPRYRQNDRIFRPAQLVRRIAPIAGSPRIRLLVRPMFDWGRTLAPVARGSSHLRFEHPPLPLRLTTDAPLTYVAESTWFTLEQPVHLLFGPDESLAGGIGNTARDMLEQTLDHWRHWSRSLALPLEWQDAVIRAAITLKLCQYEETGAIVAAMTTSIPEAPDSGRNWDYRYCWLRDSFFVVRALNSLGEVGTMENYLQWLREIVRVAGSGHVQPMYGLGLEARLPERIESHLSGYRGMGPVRVGNQAHEHRQNDVYGSMVLASSQAFHDRRLLRPASLEDFRGLEAVGQQAWRLHDQPDSGIWELRTRTGIHTSSVLMCWAACDRLARIAVAIGLPDRAQLWIERAAVIAAQILRHGWSEKRQAFTESYGSESLDASVLLMAEVGFLPARDPRLISTIDALERTLCEGPFMRRYEAADDFGRPETSFNLCTFWRIDSLARIGRTEAAREIFETMLARRNPVGLLAEDLHCATGEAWGNFPQTYSMVGIINGAVRLSRPWDSVL